MNRSQQPQFTVIVPAYNSRRTITECLESVSAQTMGAWNCIVVDDGSSDETPELVERFCRKDRRFSLMKQANAGPSAARNRAIQAATSEWVTFLDSDDRYLPGALAAFSRAAQQHHSEPRLGVLSGHYCASISSACRDQRVELVDVFITNLLPNDGPRLLPSALAVARDCFARIGPFQTMECEDLEFWLRLTTLYQVAQVFESTTLYRQDQADSRNERLKKTGQIARAHLKIMESYGVSPLVAERLSREPQLRPSFLRQHEAATDILRCCDALCQENFQAAVEAYLRARSKSSDQQRLIFYLKDLLFYPQNNPSKATIQYVSKLANLGRHLPEGPVRSDIRRSTSDACFLEAARIGQGGGPSFWRLLFQGVLLDLSPRSLKSLLKTLFARPLRSANGPLRVGVYNEPDGPGLGGSELLAAVLAESLSQEHDVEIIHRKVGLTREALSGSTGTNLERVQLRLVEVPSFHNTDYRFPWSSYRSAKNWGKEVSAGYDLLVAFVHGFPPYCHARKGALVILFPFPTPLHKSVQRKSTRLLSRLKGFLAGSYYRWEWQKRMESYPVKISISSFTAKWSRRRWEIDSQVVYPPSSLEFTEEAKTSTILSVGRFAVEGHSKRQDAMLKAFRKVTNELPAWTYVCAGALSNSAREQEFFVQLQELAQGVPARLEPNLERERLKGEYQRAKIFWHAAGFDSDEERLPEMAEHFGIVTAEAMAAGCVPIVAACGGQTDIVEHGVSGFLWNTLEELQTYTLTLARDEGLRESMAQAAKQRAQQLFSRHHHLALTQQELKPLIEELKARH